MRKLSYEDKIKIYKKLKSGEGATNIGLEYGIDRSLVYYITKLVERHGTEILKKDNNTYYSHSIKIEVVERVLINHESIKSVSLDIGLSSTSNLRRWIKNYQANGYNIVERKRGRPTMNKAKIKSKINETQEEKIKRLEEENLYLKAELEYSKKNESRCSTKEESTTEEKVSFVNELRQTYLLKILLKISGLSKSTFYYTRSKIDKDNKNKEIID